MVPDLRCGNTSHTCGCKNGQCDMRYKCGILEGMHYTQERCQLDTSCPPQVPPQVPSRMPRLTAMRLLLGAITVISMIAQFYV